MLDNGKSTKASPPLVNPGASLNHLSRDLSLIFALCLSILGRMVPIPHTIPPFVRE
jgi:hypothetical protein